MHDQLIPALTQVLRRREKLLDRLVAVRREQRERHEQRINELNHLMAGVGSSGRLSVALVP